MIACALSAARASGAHTSALQQPRDAPRRKLLARYGAADIRMSGKDHSAGRMADDRGADRRKVRKQMQHRVILQVPIDRDGAVFLQHGALRGTNEWHERHDVATANREQPSVLLEPILMIGA